MFLPRYSEGNQKETIPEKDFSICGEELIGNNFSDTHKCKRLVEKCVSLFWRHHSAFVLFYSFTAQEVR